MTESPKLKVKNQEPGKIDDVVTCEHCLDSFDTKRGLATHLRSCPDNPANFVEGEVEPIEIDKEEVSANIIDTLDLPDDVKELITSTDLDDQIQSLYTQLTNLANAKKVKVAISDAEDKKLRKKMKEMGYQRNPEVYGKFKKVILVSVEGIASCCNRETKGGWEVIPGLCTIAPNGSVYMLFKHK